MVIIVPGVSLPLENMFEAGGTWGSSLSSPAPVLLSLRCRDTAPEGYGCQVTGNHEPIFHGGVAALPLLLTLALRAWEGVRAEAAVLALGLHTWVGRDGNNEQAPVLTGTPEPPHKVGTGQGSRLRAPAAG